jgi:predicted lactoylglutathione lyase
MNYPETENRDAVLKQPTAPTQPSRERIVQLTMMAKETCDFLERKGLQFGEQCLFRQIAEQMWYAGFSK